MAMELAFALKGRATSGQPNLLFAHSFYIYPTALLSFIMSADKKAVEVDAKGIPLKSVYPDKPSVPGECIHVWLV